MLRALSAKRVRRLGVLSERTARRKAAASFDKSDAIHLASRSADSATNPARGRRFRGAVPGHDRQVAFRKPDSPPEFARRHVDEHQVQGPAAKPVVGLRRRPARQRNFTAIEDAEGMLLW
jgi:hypothetical protein